jgi:ferredoxin
VNADACTGCGVCEELCQTDAIRIEDATVAAIDSGRCIGCGLCVSCCPEDAVRLLPEGEIEPPPAPVELFLRRTAQA